MAKKFFGSPGAALGKTFRNGYIEISDPVQVVGVVKDTKYQGLREEKESIAYYPQSQLPPLPFNNFLLRANGPATSLIPGVKAAVDEVNHDITLEFRTLALQLDESLGRERLLATLSGFFGALALALAVIGLYGVMSHNVARRRNEIGIRMALGAEQSRVLRMVLGEVAILIVAGLALGLASAISGTRFLASFLYRLEPNDPTTLATACVILAAAAAVAGFLPARRAAKSGSNDGSTRRISKVFASQSFIVWNIRDQLRESGSLRAFDPLSRVSSIPRWRESGSGRRNERQSWCCNEDRPFRVFRVVGSDEKVLASWDQLLEQAVGFFEAKRMPRLPMLAPDYFHVRRAKQFGQTQKICGVRGRRWKSCGKGRVLTAPLSPPGLRGK